MRPLPAPRIFSVEKLHPLMFRSADGLGWSCIYVVNGIRWEQWYVTKMKALRYLVQMRRQAVIAHAKRRLTS